MIVVELNGERVNEIMIGMSQTQMTYGYKRVYLPLYKVADTPFHIQGNIITQMFNPSIHQSMNFNANAQNCYK